MANCNFCGSVIKDGDCYCPVCFTPIEAESSSAYPSQGMGPQEMWPQVMPSQSTDPFYMQPQPKQSNKKKILIACIAGAFGLIAIGLLIFFIFGGARNEAKSSQPVSQPSQPVVQTGIAASNGQFPQREDFANYKYGILSEGMKDITPIEEIDPNQITSYPDSLNPNSYFHFENKQYDSKFRGDVPDHLYNKVYECTSKLSGIYGTTEYTKAYFGSDGSYLGYEYITRTDNLPLNELIKELKSLEQKRLPGNFTLKRTVINGNEGTLAISGVNTNGDRVFEVFHMTEESILRMEASYPKETDELDRIQKGYIVECLDMECGFSYSGKIYHRSFETYYNDNI